MFYAILVLAELSLTIENEKLSMQETLVMMSVTSALAPARPHVRTGREGLSGHEFKPSPPRELLPPFSQKALEMIHESESVY